MNYTKFLLMIASSTLIMYVAMYLNSYELAHVFWSETRFYMSLMMGAIMALVMLAFMLNMYKDNSKNISIIIGSLALFIGSLYLVRSQTTIEDVSWMKAMIPHHSIAILTSKRANLSDPRVKQLANEIIDAQNREIGEMKVLIEGLDK